MPGGNAMVDLMALPPAENALGRLERALRTAVRPEFAAIPPSLAAYRSAEDPGGDVACDR